MANTIITFWKENPSFWITPPSKQKEVDELIHNKFWNYPWKSENLIGKIIYLDQFSRHFSRLRLISEFDVECNRYKATAIIKDNISQLEYMDEIEIIFALMPFKHLYQFDFIFEYLHMYWLDNRKISDFPDLQRFYIDTYKKAFTDDKISKNIFSSHIFQGYNPDLICEYFPLKYTLDNWNITGVYNDKILDLLQYNNKVLVSLSGGVDSMVMLTLLKSKGIDVEAVHIIYGNRPESEDEYNFLVEFCYRLGVKLYVYRIMWLRRGEIDREFYEDMTRNIRFSVYRACTVDEMPNVLLGHIREDTIENIWTNIAHCQHLGNLKKMEPEEIQLGVKILRPFLQISKSDIYRISHKLYIPYLKNTTPSWSNRGKFREHFHGSTVEQFGESIDDKIIEFADTVQTQNRLLYTLLYEPIYNSFVNNTINISPAMKINLDANGWLMIFEYVCHTYLKISRPSIKSIKDFSKRLYGKWTILNMDLNKHLKVKVTINGSDWFMEYIVR